MPRTRIAWSLSACALLALLVWAGFAWLGDQSGARNSPARRGAGLARETEPEREAPPQEEESVPGGALHIRLEAPGDWEETFPVVVASHPRRYLYQFELKPNGPPATVEKPPDETLVIAAIAEGVDPSVLGRIRDSLAWPQPVVLKRGEARGRLVRLAFAPGRSTPSVTVRAETPDRAPLPGVRAALLFKHVATAAKLPVAYATTGASGDSYLAGLPTGEYDVEVLGVPAGYEAQRATRRFRLPPDGKRTVTITCVPAGEVHGRVVLPDGRHIVQPVSVYRVQDGRYVPVRTATTDGKGGFRIETLPNGEYYAVIWPRGYGSGSAYFRVEQGRGAFVELASHSKGVRVEGALVDEKGKPVAGSRLNLNGVLAPGVPPTGCGTRTGADGGFSFEHVSSGEHHLIAWDLGLILSLTADESAGAVHSLGSLKLPGEGSCTVHGAARYRNGDPAEGGAWVCIEPIGGGSQPGWTRFDLTEGRGAFRIERLPPGRYELWVQPGPFVNGFAATERVRLELTSGDTEQDVTIALR